MSNNAARFAAVDASHGHLLSTLSETEKSLLGLPYAANEPALVRARLRARRLFLRYNQTGPSTHDPADLPSGQKPQGIGGSDDDGAEVAPGVNSEERRQLLAELFGISFEQTAQVEVEVRGAGLRRMKRSIPADPRTTLVPPASLLLRLRHQHQARRFVVHQFQHRHPRLL